MAMAAITKHRHTTNTANRISGVASLNLPSTATRTCSRWGGLLGEELAAMVQTSGELCASMMDDCVGNS